MLLRFIPVGTAAVPNPPTILFTLPNHVVTPPHKPFNPYANKSLPAPPALISFAQTCSDNELPCPTILAGDSSSWISSTVQEVAFLPSNDPAVPGEIQVLLIDGRAITMPLRQEDAGRSLDVVRDHVLESARLSNEQLASQADRKRNGTSFMSILAPLVARAVSRESFSSVVEDKRELLVSKANSARQHRRSARSKLVDCYRRWVLTELKDLLPPTYLLFTAQCMLSEQKKALSKTESDLRVLLSISGLLPQTPTPVREHTRSFSGSYFPQASTFASSSKGPSSVDYFEFPPSYILPSYLGATYTKHLSSLESTKAQVHKLERINRRFEKDYRKTLAEAAKPPACLAYKSKPQAPSPLRESTIASEDDVSESEPDFNEPLPSPAPSLCFSTSEDEDSEGSSYFSDTASVHSPEDTVTIVCGSPDEPSSSLHKASIDSLPSFFNLGLRF